MLRKLAYISLLLAFSSSSLGCLGQTFIEKAVLYDLTTGPNSNFWGNGVSFYDIDGDGRDDITIYRDTEFLSYYLSTDSGFTKVVTDVFLESGAVHVLWVDYNNDGHLDLALSHYGGKIFLYENDGAFNFTDVTVQAGITTENASNYGLSFADYDRDGHLDLYVCRYYSPQQEEAKENILYRNNGDGTFTDVTSTLNMGDGYKHSFMAVWLDINNDLYPDLYVINDRMPANTLFLNNGNGTFTDITTSAGVGFPHNDPMSATVSDFDNDGDLDIFMTNSGSLIEMPVMLLVNEGNNTFSEMANQMNLGHQNMTWGAVWFDFNNNGWRDLFFVSSELVQNGLFINIGGQYFLNGQSQISNIPIARGFTCAAGDYNNDGYADIIISNMHPHQHQFLVNQGGDNHYIKICLHGTVSNPQAIGSWIHVHRGAEAYHHYTLCGENYLGQNSQNIIFGLGDSDLEPDSVVVYYPSGHKDVYYDLAVDQIHHLTEGETYNVTLLSSNGNGLCPEASTILDAGAHAAYLWSTGDTLQHIEVTTPATYSVSVFNQYGVEASTEIEILMYPTPLISAFVLQPLCHGEATGAIALTNNLDVDAEEVWWNHEATGAFLDSLGAGEYAYTFTDVNGCIAEGTVLLNEPSELVVLIQLSPEITGNDGSIYTAVFGGIPPYSIMLNSDTVANFVTGLAGGTYNLQIFDQNNCGASTEVTISTSLSTVDGGARHLRIFPNPSSEIIQIEYPSSVKAARLMDVNGKIVWQSISESITRINMKNLPTGTYLCALDFADGTHYVEKVIKSE